MKKYYVGCRQGERTVFQSDVEPTKGSTPQYNAVIGPFRTQLAAEFMADFGANNPYMQTVQDTECMAARYLKLAEDNIDNKTETAYDLCAELGQIFSNVKRMPWFRERLAYELLDSGITA